MEKSQLRQLALDHAQGELAFDDYVRERGELIDAIVAGRLTISRLRAEARAPVSQETDASGAPTVRIEAPVAQTGPSPVYIGVGIAVLVMVAVLATLFWPGETPPAPQPIASPVAVLPPPAPKPAAEQLVTAFVTENNWNESSTDGFLARWRALTEADRGEARSAPWFRDLTTGLRQEINARHALASLPGGGADRIDGMRLVAFARALELNDQYPDFGADDQSDANAATSIGALADTNVADSTASTVASAAETTSSAPLQAKTSDAAGETANAAETPGVQTTDAASATDSASTTSNTLASATSGSSVGAVSDDTSEAWFNALPTSHNTLQLFVVSQLAEIQKLERAHPDIVLHHLKSPASGGRTIYYVVHGDFADAKSARSAFDALPAELRRDQKFALVKTVAELRERIATPAPDTAPLAPAADAYTLQLFVFGQRDNADKVLAQFPNLPLWVHESTATPQEFRVLLGRYGDAEQARSARTALPGALTAKAGVPVVKRVTDPAGPGISRE